MWYDCYNLAKEKDNGFTVEKVIDGWKDKLKEKTNIRIDHISVSYTHLTLPTKLEV